MTFDKQAVVAAANKAAQAARAERKQLCAAYDAHSVFYRFLNVMSCGGGRPNWHRVGDQKIAERIVFKAQFCTEQTIALSNEEIDILKDYWPMAGQ